jgi:hypothetical protein
LLRAQDNQSEQAKLVCLFVHTDGCRRDDEEENKAKTRRQIITERVGGGRENKSFSSRGPRRYQVVQQNGEAYCRVTLRVHSAFFLMGKAKPRGRSVNK